MTVARLPMKLSDLLAQPNGSLPDCLSAVAQQRPEHPALILNGVTLNYREFDQLVSRAAASLQRDGVQRRPGTLRLLPRVRVSAHDVI